MNKEDVLNLRDMLLERRKDLIDRVTRLQAGWQDLEERAIELEEEAQKATITDAYGQLDHNGKKEIEQIDLAFTKMAVGDYGLCESCGDEIALRRLEALPWTRLCVDCAREYEKRGETLPQTSEIIITAKLPDEFHGLGYDQVVKMVYDRLNKDGRVDTDELKISIRRGILHLDGIISSQPEYQILMQTITDVMGFSSIVDHIEVNELFSKKEERTSGRNGDGSSAEDELFYAQDDFTEDLFEAGDERPYSPPERPLPQQEHDYTTK
jgi:DnaK suppressor protein